MGSLVTVADDRSTLKRCPVYVDIITPSTERGSLIRLDAET